MAWFALGRIMFVVVVAYAAALLQPLSVGMAVNVGFGLALAGLVVLFESRLRETAVTRGFGAVIGCAGGLGIPHPLTSGPFLGGTGDPPGAVPPSLLLLP